MIEAFLRKALGIGNRRAGNRGAGSQGGGNQGGGNQGNSSASGNTSGAVKAEANGIKFNIKGTNYEIGFSGGSLRVFEILEPVVVKGGKAGWADWGNRMHSRYGDILGYNFEGYGQSNEFWSNVKNGFSIMWNSPIARRYVPDKITIAFGGEFATGIGGGFQPFNLSILTRGQTPGFYYTPTYNVNAGGGFFGSGGFELTISNYTGNPREIHSSMITGNTYGLMATGGILLDLSVGLSYSPVGNISAGKGFINASIGIGVGIGAFVGAQYQYTPAAIPLK